MAFAPQPKFQAFDDSGFPLSGGHLKTFIAGSSTPIETYTDESLSIANQVDITLNSRGEADVHLKTNIAYKFILLTANNVVIWTVDNITAGTSGSGGSVSWTDITGKPNDFNPAPHNQSWLTITSRPTTIGGYGITDAYTKTEVDAKDLVLQNQITTNTSAIGDIDVRLTSVEGAVTTIQGDIVDLENVDIALQNQISINTSAISVLQSNDAAIFNNLTTLNYDVGALSGALSGATIDKVSKSGDTMTGPLVMSTGISATMVLGAFEYDSATDSFYVTLNS